MVLNLWQKHDKNPVCAKQNRVSKSCVLQRKGGSCAEKRVIFFWGEGRGRGHHSQRYRIHTAVLHWKTTACKARLHAQGHRNITGGADIAQFLFFGMGSVGTSLLGQKRVGHCRMGIGSAKSKNGLGLFILVALRFIPSPCWTGHDLNWPLC